MRTQKEEILKKILLVASLTTCLISSAFADNHGSASDGNGAFSTLFVAAKDVESYIESVKANPALFEMSGGKFIRDSDGSLVLRPEITAAREDPLIGWGAVTPKAE